MDGFTIAWIVWIGAFLAIEGAALFNSRKGDTLSEHAWLWFAVKDKRARFGQARRAVLGMGLAWLALHFLTGGYF